MRQIFKDMNLHFFAAKDITLDRKKNIFKKTIDSVKNLRMTQIVRGGRILLNASLRLNVYKNRHVTHP